MSIQIDQSGKIEDTSKDTVIAFSNDIQASVLLPKRIKRRIQEAFRYHGETELFIYQTFATATSYLLNSFKTKQTITIDIEYPGKDKLIAKIIIQQLESSHKPKHDIRFARIGNSPKAHYAAKDVFDKKKRPTKIITSEMVLQKQKDRWALKRMSFNPGRRSGPGLINEMLPKKRRMSSTYYGR